MNTDAHSTPLAPVDPLATEAHITIELLRTVRDWLRFCASSIEYGHRGEALYLGHGTVSAWDESVALVLGALHLPPDSGAEVLDGTLLPAERQQVYTLITRRVQERIPLPYLLGEAWFAGHLFKVDSRVLIPRSPIGELITEGYSAWFPDRDPEHLLDLCAGSGCIGIASALALPTTEVTLADISKDALAVADENIQRFKLESRVHTVQGDMFEGLPCASDVFPGYDLIVCNPPYVDARDLANMPEEFRHEPELALGSGEDGLDFTRRLLGAAAAYLAHDGILIVEVGNSERQLCEAYPELPFIWLEFEQGGHGVFVLTREDLLMMSPDTSYS